MITQRPARADDADAIVDLMMDGFASYSEWAPDWDPPAGLRSGQQRLWRDGLAGDDGSWTWVAEEGGELVAVARVSQALARHRTGPPVPGLAHIGAVFVRPDRWGRGLGRTMLVAALKHAREQGYQRVRLLVPEGNGRARELYEGHGFESLGRWREDLLGLPVLHYEAALTGR